MQRPIKSAQLRGNAKSSQFKRKPAASGSASEAKSSTRVTKTAKRKKIIKDRVITPLTVALVPESQTYMDLLAFETKLDSTIMRKRLDIQEALKRPVKQKRTLRFRVSSQVHKPDEMIPSSIPEWELRVEGRLLEQTINRDLFKPRRKFSSFFKNVVIEVDQELYGPVDHLVEWRRTPATQETDGFQIKRPMLGRSPIECTLFFMFDYQPQQFKLSGPLSRILGIHTQTRAVIVSALWQYVKRNRLQDADEREYVNNDIYLKEIFNEDRIKFSDIPRRLQAHLLPPDPIIVKYTVDPMKSPGEKKCYDISLELDDSLRDMMQSFLLSSNSQQELASLDSKIQETVESINQLKTRREFFLSFADNPQKFMNKWLASQSTDLRSVSGVIGNLEEERNSEFYNQTWAEEAVARYFFRQIQVKRVELEQALGTRPTST